jgi:DNA repair protein RadC
MNGRSVSVHGRRCGSGGRCAVGCGVAGRDHWIGYSGAVGGGCGAGCVEGVLVDSGVPVGGPEAVLGAVGDWAGGLLMLQAALELARRHHWDQLRKGPALSTPGSTSVYLLSQLRDLPYEVFRVLHLDNRHRLIAFEELFRGTIDGANVHVREVARRVMVYNSAAVIIAHNHPSGVAEPSDADVEVTRRLRQSLGLLNVRVLDHVVVGDGVCVSFAERGLISDGRRLLQLRSGQFCKHPAVTALTLIS